MKNFLIFLKKDLSLELREKEFLFSAINLSILIAVLMSSAILNAFIDSETTTRLFPSLFWIGAFFIALLSLGRAVGYEHQFHTAQIIATKKNLLTPYYLAKVTSTAFFVFITSTVFLLLLSVLLNQTSYLTSASLIIIVGFSIGFSTVGILLSNLTNSASTKELLFSLLMLPLLFPLFFACSELSYLARRTPIHQDWSVLSSPWFTLLILINLVYLWASSFLFPHVIKE